MRVQGKPLTSCAKIIEDKKSERKLTPPKSMQTQKNNAAEFEKDIKKFYGVQSTHCSNKPYENSKHVEPDKPQSKQNVAVSSYFSYS